LREYPQIKKINFFWGKGGGKIKLPSGKIDKKKAHLKVGFCG
jgi:hypothetical protein